VKTASQGLMKGIVQFCDEEIVSSDLKGSPFSCIFDEKAGVCLNPNFYKFIAWYEG
jgi:glyceraldehyde 3-phosphate dehydrogenase